MLSLTRSIVGTGLSIRRTAWTQCGSTRYILSMTSALKFATFRDCRPISFIRLWALPNWFTNEEIIARFRNFNVNEKDLEKAFYLMLWYGVLGIASNRSGHFIYDYGYDMKRLEAEIKTATDEVLY